VIPSQMTSGAS